MDEQHEDPAPDLSPAPPLVPSGKAMLNGKIMDTAEAIRASGLFTKPEAFETPDGRTEYRAEIRVPAPVVRTRMVPRQCTRPRGARRTAPTRRRGSRRSSTRSSARSGASGDSSDHEPPGLTPQTERHYIAGRRP